LLFPISAALTISVSVIVFTFLQKNRPHPL
jgi:hypothetical protein